MLYALFERAQRLQVFQIADVVTQEGVRPARQAESVFQLRAAGEYLALEFERGLQRRGRVAARATQDRLAPALNARDRIVRTNMYAPVVRQEIIGDCLQPLDGVPIFVADRLIRDVAAGHHERAFEFS